MFGMQDSIESASCCKVIIDCDPGVDDAHAIIMLLAQKHIEVVAITTVFGNESLEDITRNAVRVLKLCKRLDVSCPAIYVAALSATVSSAVIISITVSEFHTILIKHHKAHEAI